MSNLPLVRHGLDKTGLNPDNFVFGEVQTVPANSIRSVVPKYGPYFAESLKVFDAVSTKQLQRGIDFSCIELLQEVTAETGKEIYALIIITNKNVSNKIRIDYQAVGGLYIYETKTIVEVLNALALDERMIAYYNVRNRPSSFNPTKHLHDIGDIYGFEYVCAMLQRIRRAINLKYMPVLDLILKNADNKLALLNQLSNDTAGTAAAHIANQDNPHNLTAAQVNLGSVVNLALATAAEIDTLVLLPDTTDPASISPDKYLGLRDLLEFKRKVVAIIDADAQARMDIVMQNEQADVAARTAILSSLSQTVTTNKANQTAVNTTVSGQITNFNNAIEARRSAMAPQFTDLNNKFGLLPGRISSLQATVNSYRAAEQTDVANLNSGINGLNNFLNNINAARIAHENRRDNPHADSDANTGYVRTQTLTGIQTVAGTYSGQSGFSVDRWSDGTTRLTLGFWPHDPPNNQTSDWHWLQFGGVENNNRRNGGLSNYWDGVDVIDLANIPVGNTYAFRASHWAYSFSTGTFTITRTATNQLKFVLTAAIWWSTGDTGTTVSIESWYRNVVALSGGSVTSEYIPPTNDHGVGRTVYTIDKGELYLTW